MDSATHQLEFSGLLLDRGFWLYVWDITTAGTTHLYYVGRTGDSSSNNAQSPFDRMSRHLGFNKNNNVLRRRLQNNGIDANKCDFRLVAYGPILKEAKTLEQHQECRDRIAAMEKALANAMAEAGYMVINQVHCRTQLDVEAFEAVRTAFATHFKKLPQRSEAETLHESQEETRKSGGHS